MTEKELLGNTSAYISEFFTDYVVIGRVKDGLVWRYSDRTFAQGAIKRLADRLDTDDRIAVEGMNDESGR